LKRNIVVHEYLVKRSAFYYIEIMPYKIQNKMYVLTGGLSPDDKLSDFRYFTKYGLGRVPRGYIHRIFDIALEVDVTGLNIEFDRYEGDAYWTCCDHERCLKDVKLTRIAYIDGKWRKLDIDPYADAYDWLKEQGYYDKLGYGGGWFSKDNCPSYKELVYEYFNYKGSNHSPEWDTKTKLYAGIIADHKHDQFKIYNGDSPNFIQKYVGSIRVEGETVIIRMHDDEYKFHRETDEDFIRWTKMCVEGYNEEFLMHVNDEDSKRDESENREHAKDAAERAVNEAEWKQFLAERIDFEVRLSQHGFQNKLSEYFKEERRGPQWYKK